MTAEKIEVRLALGDFSNLAKSCSASRTSLRLRPKILNESDSKFFVKQLAPPRAATLRRSGTPVVCDDDAALSRLKPCDLFYSRRRPNRANLCR